MNHILNPVDVHHVSGGQRDGDGEHSEDEARVLL